MQRTGLLAESRIRAFQSLDGELAHRLWNAGIRNEMAVVDTTTHEIRTGIDGFLQLLEHSRLSPLARILAVSPLRWLSTLTYRVLAYNRRILAPPPRSSLPCACDPDPHTGYQWALITLLLVPAAAILALFAAKLGGFVTEQPARTTALFALGGATTGLALATGLPPAAARQRLSYLGHLAAAILTGLLPLLAPLVASIWIEGQALLAILLAAVVISAVRIWREQRRRHGAMGLGPARSWTWPMLLWGGVLVGLILAQT